uniref:Uncharacterized protein n=1 Tax=Spongospora subterranea TaxID=70186 RepID=A0A0H5QRN5_9EUKA|eukprot:CRZ04201.1 hypothetical protein [Spongospora subterranea]
MRSPERYRFGMCCFILSINDEIPIAITTTSVQATSTCQFNKVVDLVDKLTKPTNGKFLRKHSADPKGMLEGSLEHNLKLQPALLQTRKKIRHIAKISLFE